METLATTFIITTRKNQFIQEDICNNPLVRRIATALNTNSAFTGSQIESPFGFQVLDLRQSRILRDGQSTVDLDASENCYIYVSTMKAMNFQDDIPSIPSDNFKDHHVLVFGLASLQDAFEKNSAPAIS